MKMWKCENCGELLEEHYNACGKCSTPRTGAAKELDGSESLVAIPEPTMESPMEDAVKYQTFWPRVGAALLDSAALAPFEWLDTLIWNSGISTGLLLIPWSLFYALLQLAYPILFVAKFGQTLGKMACNVKIIDIKRNPLRFHQAVMRCLVPVLTTPIFIFIQTRNILRGELEKRALGDLLGDFSAIMWIVGILLGWGLLEFITMLTNQKRRAIHDYIAGTVVVRVEATRSHKLKVKALRWFLFLLLIFDFIISHLIEENNLR